MKFVPFNKYILVEKLPFEKKQSNVFIPDDHKNIDGYFIVKMLLTENGSYFESHEGQLMVVDAQMIETIKFQEQEYCIIKEQFVKGFINNE